MTAKRVHYTDRASTCAERQRIFKSNARARGEKHVHVRLTGQDLDALRRIMELGMNQSAAIAVAIREYAERISP